MGGKVYNLTEGRKLQYAGGRIYKSNRLSTSRGAGEYDKGQYEDVAFFDFMDDVCVLVTSKMVREVGAYDKDFFFDWEETEWNHRIIQRGYKIAYNPKMQAWHRKHGSTSGSRYASIPEKYHWRGKLLFYYKTRDSMANFEYFFLSLIFLEVPIHWIVLIIKGHTNLIWSNFCGIYEGLKLIIRQK